MFDKLDYVRKQEKALFSDLAWNFPEQKQGLVMIIGGNSQNFSAVNRSMDRLSRDFPVREVVAGLPESLRRKLPPVPNLMFFPATESGSFAKSSELSRALLNFDMGVFIGDFSKNSETAAAIAEAVVKSEKEMIITRDTIDLLAADMGEIISKENVILIGSMMQMQKVFRAVYYPKMLMLSMPLLSALEALHKFTISYPATILTFHEGQIIVAKGGEIITTKIDMTDYSPISLWDSRLAMDVVGFNLYNPKKELQATSAAVLGM